MKITKQELKDIIKEVISEQTVPREIEDAVRIGGVHEHQAGEELGADALVAVGEQ